ncbi:hypothetical protein [Kitasatospora sp. NPDC059673]|uniref:hypothetical protein n=1 Tax=Kitasatospora sp. NPDC059673 TaxID=3346901 RepID=UPI0036CE5A1D
MRKNIFRRARAALLGAAAIALMAPATTASAADVPEATLAAGDKLMPGQSLKAGEAALVMQADGNLVLRLEGPTGARGPELWATGTWGNPGAYAFMQPDGNLVVYRQGSTSQSDALWSTGTWGDPGARLMLGLGSLTVGGQSKHWASGTGLYRATCAGGTTPGSCIAPNNPGMNPGHWIQSKSVWLVNQQDGNLVLYRKRDGAALWSSGTWNRPGAVLFVQDSTTFTGVLHLSNPYTGKITWSTPATGRPGAYAVVQDDGNFVAYSNGTALWSTGTWGNW